MIMSDQQQSSPFSVAQNNSIVVGAAIIALSVIMFVSIIANCWLRSKKPQIMPKGSWKPSDRHVSFQMLTRPALVFNRETTLPVYRKSDTWDSYVQMIQTPDKLNDVVHSMKVHTPSSSISSFSNHTDRGINYTKSPLQKDHSNTNDDDDD